MRKLIINISLIVFTVINIPILNSTYAQSGKAKKAHEAILNGEFDKAEVLLKVLNDKNDEIALTAFLKYEFYQNKGNTKYYLDSAFEYFNRAYYHLSFLEEEKTTQKFIEYFSFGIIYKEAQRKIIIESAYDEAYKKKSVVSFEHFINYYGQNWMTDQAILELDKILYENVINYNSIDSLYLFKSKYRKSQFLIEIDEQIVFLKFNDCRRINSLECLKGIKSEFPKSKQIDEINKSINEIIEQIAIERFEKCQKTRSIKCLEEIITEFPAAQVTKKILFEKEKILFENYCNSNNIDSIYLFINSFKNSPFKDTANLVFKRIIEDTISKLKALFISDNWEKVISDFHPKYQIYILSNDSDETIKTKYENLFISSLNSQSSKNKIEWVKKEFPNIKNNLEFIKLENKINQNENIGFFKELEWHHKNKDKYGILNMSTGSFVVDNFFDEVKKFSNGLAAVQLYGKWGYINIKGEIIIPCIYQQARSFNDVFTGVCKEGVWFLIDKTGSRVSDNEYLKIGDFGNGIVNVQPYTGGWIYINNKEEVKSPRTYFNATNFINGLAAVSTKNSEVLIIDESFKVLNDITLCLDKKSGYYGEYGSPTRNIESFEYCDTRQEYVINSFLYYDKYTNTCNAGYYPDASDYSENLLTFDLTGTYLLDGRGIIYYNGTYQSSNFSSREYSLELGEGHYFGYTIRDNDITVYRQLFGLESLPINDFTEVPTRYVGVDFKLNFNIAHELVEERYNETLGSYKVMPFKLISFNKDFAVISKELGQGIITKSGTLINNVCSFESITPIMDGICIVGSKPGYFLMDVNGKKQSALYSSIKRLNSELFIVSEKGNPKSYLINKNEQVLSDYYDIIESKIICNTILVSNSNGNKKAHGLIDINGKVLVPLIYDDVFCTYGNLVFGKCPNGNNRACNFDIYNYSGKKIKTLIDYLRYGFIDSSGLKFFKGHYSKVNTNGERKVIIDDEYLLPNFK